MSNNNIIQISAKKDFIERQSSAKSLPALAELIWNGLDSGSNIVETHCVLNALDGLEEIRIKDTGTGIDHSKVKQLFGDLGSSWKRDKHRLNGRALHGKNGQGRLKAFALGNHVTWKTTYENAGKFYSYEIKGIASDLESLSFTDPVISCSNTTGTEVLISEITKSHGSLLSENTPQELAKIFAPYLSQYPIVKLKLNNEAIDPTFLQQASHEFPLKPITSSDGNIIETKLKLIEWSVKTKRMLHICDSDGVSLHEQEAGIQTPSFEFTAYFKSDYFRSLDKDNFLYLNELHTDVQQILNQGKRLIRDHFRERLAQKQSQIVKRWKDEKVYPYINKSELTAIELAERQVFEILAVNVESYLPKFSDSNYQSRKFTFKLLAQALRDNPASVQKIITELLNLKKEEQDELAELMEKTSLSNIISSAQTVANRLNFLLALENLLFDKESKKKLLERDQLHKILEHEAWLFDEEFTLSGSEKRLEEVLELHLDKLGSRVDAPVLREDDKQGRVDLMLSRCIQPRQDEKDHLIVELKRPSQKINSEVLNQVESYAIAVANDKRFLKEKTRWRFIAVSNEFDEHARKKANQRNRPKGLVFDDADLNIEVWAFDWTEIISNARTRLQFINSSLNYEADRDTAKNYLMKVHAKYIPNFNVK